MGFKTVAIEKRSSEIWKLLGQFKRDFGTFSELLVKTKRQLEIVSNTIDGASNRTKIIQKRLNKVETDNEDILEGSGFGLDLLEGEIAADEN
jgi:DNA recombination protein RmuC